MREQGVPTVEDVRHGVELMLPQSDFWVYAGERDMLPVVFTRTSAVEYLVVLLRQIAPPVRVFPYPVLKSILDGLLLLLGEGSLLTVEHAALFAVCVDLGVIYPHIAEV